MKIFLFVVLLAGFAQQAAAKEGSFVHRQIAEGPLSTDELIEFNEALRTQCVERQNFGIQEMITLGKEIWQIVQAGAPVVNYSTEMASVIPSQAECAFNLSNWTVPRSKTFELSYKNKFGGEMIYFSYKIIYTAGGKFEGRGSYLANVSIHPVDIRLMWGQSFDAFVKVNKAINVGSAEDPVAGLEVSLQWVIKNPVMESQSHRSYFVDGSGQLVEL